MTFYFPDQYFRNDIVIIDRISDGYDNNSIRLQYHIVGLLQTNNVIIYIFFSCPLKNSRRPIAHLYLCERACAILATGNRWKSA